MWTSCKTYISIHAPHEGERRNIHHAHHEADKFQSTLPTRGGDPRKPLRAVARADFNPRSPRGGATPQHKPLSEMTAISIHAPHEGERPIPTLGWVRIKEFQSTLPTRGSDRNQNQFCSQGKNFNPRSPRGGATTILSAAFLYPINISIHAPHEGERPRSTFDARLSASYFNPRSPRGGATSGKVHLYAAFPRIC